MSRSEFRWNKKRKHYAYQFKDIGKRRKNFLLHSDPSKKESWNEEKQKDFDNKHTKLVRHPNVNKPRNQVYYVENRIYVDDCASFSDQVYPWNWDRNDKRKIKRLKKRHRTRQLKP